MLLKRRIIRRFEKKKFRTKSAYIKCRTCSIMKWEASEKDGVHVTQIGCGNSSKRHEDSVAAVLLPFPHPVHPGTSRDSQPGMEVVIHNLDLKYLCSPNKSNVFDECVVSQKALQYFVVRSAISVLLWLFPI